jgi:hypothetical protein
MIAALNPDSHLNRKGHLPRQVTLTIEPGHEEMWFALREFRGPFTADDLAQAVGGKTSSATRYLINLQAHGRAIAEGQTTDKKRCWRVMLIGATPMVLDEDGTPSDDYALRFELWRATRRLKHGVTAGRLLDMVGEHRPVTARDVHQWINRLVAADYLTLLAGKSKQGETEYQLRGMRDTGPLPPRFAKATLLYDVNLAIRGEKSNAFFGVGLAKEVRL